MSIKTQIILLGIVIFIIFLIIADLLNRMDQAEKDIRFLVDFINKELKERTNDNKNTNAHYTQKK